MIRSMVQMMMMVMIMIDDGGRSSFQLTHCRYICYSGRGDSVIDNAVEPIFVAVEVERVIGLMLLLLLGNGVVQGGVIGGGVPVLGNESPPELSKGGEREVGEAE